MKYSKIYTEVTLQIIKKSQKYYYTTNIYKISVNSNCIQTNIHKYRKLLHDPKEIHKNIHWNNRRFTESEKILKNIWKLKNTHQNYLGKQYHLITYLKTYNLYVWEKITIITFPEQDKVLNKRTELIFKCRH